MLMADHLILSLQPLPCFPHRRWNLSRRFPSGIRFSIPEFRLSSQLANSTSHSQSSPENFDLVSTTQLKDGSHVFRFGDASEIEKFLETEQNLKKQQRAKIVEEDSGVSRKQRGKDEHALADLDRVSELESSKEESGVSSSLSNVIKIKDRKRVRSSTKKKNDNVEAKIAIVSNLSSTEKEVVSGKSELINEDVIKAGSYNVEPLSSEVMEEVSVNEIGDSELNGYQQITENVMDVQARARLSTSQDASQFTIELDDSLDVKETTMKSSEAEDDLVVQPTFTAVVSPDKPVSDSGATAAVSPDKPVSTSEATADVSPDKPVSASEATAAVSSDEPVSTSEATADVSPDKPVSASEATAVVSPDKPVSASEATAIVSPDEPVSTSEATHHSIDQIVEDSVVDTSDVVYDEVNAASAIEDEITMRDTKTDNGSISTPVNDPKVEDLQLPAPETAGLESSEVASDREELVSKAFYLDSGFASLPSPVEALAGREDAYFISHHNWLGIADGVSQWSFGGINKGLYAQELMSNCEKIVSDETAKTLDPVQVLHRSVNATKSLGSSTVLIAHLDNNELHIANIGDSGFMVIRNGTTLQRSSPMFHHFCFPLQITQGDDVLKLAEVYNVDLEEGDVVITATDGLYDNLYEEEIVSIVCSSLEQSWEPQRIAELVAAKAQEVGGSGKERTPFADAAKEEGYDGYKGGKLDAVTVIISLVKDVSA